MSLADAISSGYSAAPNAGVQGMLDTLGSFMSGPPADLTDPNAVRAEIQRLQQAGDQSGAIAMIAHLRTLEGDARRKVTQGRQDAEYNSQLQPVQPVARTRANEFLGKQAAEAIEEAKTKEQDTAIIARLKAKGMDSTVEGIQNGTISAKEAYNEIKSRETTERAARVAEVKSAGAKKVKREEKMAADTESIKGAINTLGKTDPQAAQKAMEIYGPDLAEATPGELSAIKSIVTSQKFLNPSEADANGEFAWSAGTTAQRKFVRENYDDAIGDIIEDYDMAGDDVIGTASDAREGYVYLMGSAINSVMKSGNVNEVTASGMVLDQIEAAAKAGAKTIEDVGAYLEANLNQAKHETAVSSDGWGIVGATN